MSCYLGMIKSWSWVPRTTQLRLKNWPRTHWYQPSPLSPLPRFDCTSPALRAPFATTFPLTHIHKFSGEFEGRRLKAKIPGGTGKDEPKIDVDDVSICIQQDVAVVPEQERGKPPLNPKCAHGPRLPPLRIFLPHAGTTGRIPAEHTALSATLRPVLCWGVETHLSLTCSR